MKIPSTTTKLALAAGSADDKAIGLITSPVYRFRVRHPMLYAAIAFVLGGAVVGLFTMTTYTNWAFEGIDLKTAFYQVIFGSLGGGIVLVILAFAYTATIRPTLASGTQNPPQSGQ
jgi:protein-S-isoprenylcysteine O-methyltransferase Ste14